jgi:hypothetical protein
MLVRAVMVGLRGLEPRTSSLSGNDGLPLCKPAFLLVAADRKSGPDRQQFAFDDPTIRTLLTTEPMAPSGAACLYLAWQHQALLLS